jgi:hypothetical protein
VFVYVTVESYKEIHCICHPNFLLASVYCAKCLTFFVYITASLLRIADFISFVWKSTCTSGLLSTAVLCVQSSVGVCACIALHSIPVLLFKKTTKKISFHYIIVNLHILAIPPFHSFSG